MNHIETSNSEFEELKLNLLLRSNDLMMLPEVASQALEFAKDPECNIDELACLVERDVKLAAEILQLVNSPVFASRSPIVSLKQAIVRLGLRQCRNIILTTSAASLIKNLPLEHDWFREIIWQHSFTTATACVHLNRSLNLGFHGEEFTAGLLHDFGRLLLAVASPEMFSRADDLSFIETPEILGRERRILGVDHCQFGAWFAESQGLPQPLVNVIANHHNIENSTNDKKLLAVVVAGDEIANHLQRFEEVAHYEPVENQGVALLSELYSAPLQSQFFGIANTLLDEVIRDSDLSSKVCRKTASECNQ